ncbi:MAG TPA: bifunctional UDP-sugar hydrolase/5'-nucleotidase [Syntrophomonadaceae bacterium]|nr:bifunctional UDP-sugar hydrolase/5'-nucleotidase [Syntrophomonadaceae bacterium]HRX21886.1 bifunctional UDP-sugar hydrolase/5'-nucleotidase [Syntrophomonadaceae bacterium]
MLLFKLMRSLMVVVFIFLATMTFAFPAVAADKEDYITIIFTHDLHDHILPFTLDKGGTINEYGGFALIKSAVDEERETDPELLLLDAGDFSMGTLFQTIFAESAPGLSLMGQMGYDAATFGNHEFDYRAQGLADCLNAARQNNQKLPALLVSNVVFPDGDKEQLTESLSDLNKAMTDYGTREYIILERNGKRIGIFGLIGSEAISNAPMAEVAFADPLKTAVSITETLKNKEKVDLIICLSHSGTSNDGENSEDELLAQKVPDIDVIISGHSHTKLTEPIITGRTIICSTGEYGEHIGLLKIKDDEDNNWQVSHYQLLPIDDRLPADSGITATVEKYRQKVQTDYLDDMGMTFDQVLAYSPFSFLPAAEIGVRHEEEPLANLIGDAYIYAVKAAEGTSYEPIAAAVVPSGTIRGTFLKGNITVADAFAVSSLGIGPDKKAGYPLISVYLTGRELKTACEVDASVAPLMKPAQLYIAGMTYTFNPHRLMFNKVTSASLLESNGNLEEIDDDSLYRVVAGLYSAQMLTVVGEKSFGILSIVPKNKDGEPIVDFEEHIIKDLTGGNNNEIKEWAAIAGYLQSFAAQDGIPQIPLYYSQPQGRKIVSQDTGLSAVWGDPNAFALKVYLITALLLLLIIFIVYKVMKRRKTKLSATLDR